ncbi:exosortase [Stanieria cyanosphaera PCC 7437]|uniref:Exosortase n=1 Tax=Stanieria cyanosphaera (strain ATCC 29371 / PCC 7437) TaxID=111780 RepID=K9XUR8_STAC7|nr:cyanoexosortase A [Stanieria cyanosphaera]AFZ36283.1 exosortase [Stanieria cyanosphaera PCC 7437]
MRRSLKTNQFWFYASLISLAVFYLTLTWKNTQNVDFIVTNSLFWGAIFLLLWRKRKQFSFGSDFFSTTFGLFLLTIVLIKSVSLVWFESLFFLPLTPFFGFLGLIAIAFGLKELRKYWWELLLSGVLFFPSDTLGWWFNRLFQIQIMTAKLANYLLYYFGFNTISQNYNIVLHLPEQGYFTASVNYSCTGVSMIILMFKLALLLESLVMMKQLQRFLFPTAAVMIGFFLGTIRVTIMTVLLPEPDKFTYWHGTEGAQIFSTLAIVIFSSFCYLQLKEQKFNSLTRTRN